MDNYEKNDQYVPLNGAEDSAQEAQQDGKDTEGGFTVTTGEGIRMHVSNDWLERMAAAEHIFDVAEENNLPIYETECSGQREGVMVGNETARALIDIDRAMYDSYVPVIVDERHVISDEDLFRMNYKTEFDGKELYLYATDEPDERTVVTRLPDHFLAFALHGVVVIRPRTE